MWVSTARTVRPVRAVLSENIPVWVRSGSNGGLQENRVRLNSPEKYPKTYKKPRNHHDFGAKCWSWMRDSDSRPHDYESGALPTELIQHLRRSPPQDKGYYTINAAFVNGESGIICMKFLRRKRPVDFSYCVPDDRTQTDIIREMQITDRISDRIQNGFPLKKDKTYQNPHGRTSKTEENIRNRSENFLQ